MGILPPVEDIVERLSPHKILRALDSTKGLCTVEAVQGPMGSTLLRFQMNFRNHEDAFEAAELLESFVPEVKGGQLFVDVPCSVEELRQFSEETDMVSDAIRRAQRLSN
jgi:hypothetical protein